MPPSATTPSSSSSGMVRHALRGRLPTAAWKETREGTAVAEQWARWEGGMMVEIGERARGGGPQDGANGRTRAGGNRTRLGGRAGAAGEEMEGVDGDDEGGGRRDGGAKGGEGGAWGGAGQGGETEMADRARRHRGREGGGARGHGAHHMPTFSPLANNQLIESVCAQGTGPAKMSASLAL